MAENGKTEKDEKMRVKLYMLNAGRVWDDQGTGYVSSTFIEKTKNMFLLVKEENRNTVLLESKIQLNTAYQKQQETLIVWSEADNYDYALSFQNKAGCDEIWAQICQVQGKDPSVDITQELMLDQDDGDVDDDRFDSVTSSHVSHHDDTLDRVSMSLPPCEMSRLDDIVDLFQASLATPAKREKLATLIENENYVPKLAELFRISEDLDDKEALQKHFTAFKSLFFLNKTPVFEAMFADDVIFDVIGALEYDPSLTKQVKHREFLRTQTRLKQAVPIDNSELIQKIHQTYRVQYIQDAILPAPSVFEENLLSTLTSFIYFNKMEIVTVLQEDEKYLQTLFRQLMDDDTDDEARRDMVVFLKEFCSFSQNLVQQNRERFYKVLSKLGILNALEVILGMDDVMMKSLAIDIFSYIVEFSPSMVREFFLQESQRQEDEDLLINMVIEQMITDPDPELGGALQLMGIIRLLIDPENMSTAPQKNEKSEFLTFFYPHCMHVLTAPLFSNTAGDVPSRDDYQTAQLLAHILELLMFCVEHHTYHIKTYMVDKQLLKRILVLLRSKHAFLQLASLRLLRRTIGLKDEFYNKYIVKSDLLKLVVDAFVGNGSKYNLFNSAVLELFEFIKTEDIRTLINHFVKNHYKPFESIPYVQTFKILKQRYEQQQEKYTHDSVDFLSSVPLKPDQSMDEDEEAWFDQDEDFDDVPSKLSPKLDFDSFSPARKFIPNKLSATGNNTLGRSPMPHSMSSSINHCNKPGSISFNLNLKDHNAFAGLASRSKSSDNNDIKTRLLDSFDSVSPSNSLLGSHPASSPSASQIKSSSGLESAKSSNVSRSTVVTDSSLSGGLVAVKAKTSSLLGLVDYDDEDDEDDEDSSNVDAVTEKHPAAVVGSGLSSIDASCLSEEVTSHQLDDSGSEVFNEESSGNIFSSSRLDGSTSESDDEIVAPSAKRPRLET